MWAINRQMQRAAAWPAKLIVPLMMAIAYGVFLDEIGKHLNTQRREPGLAMEHVEGRLPDCQSGSTATSCSSW